MAIRRYHQSTIWGWIVQQLLDPTHVLLILAQQIDWDAIMEALLPFYKSRGRCAKPIRLMVGLHLLKHRYNLSDAAVVEGLHENLYWMVFCGIDLGTVLEHTQPGETIQGVEASTLCKWRQRLGPEGGQRLETIIYQQMVREKVLQGKTMRTDTTAMEKHIAYPTDTRLLEKGRRQLLRLIGQANALGVEVPKSLRSFTRTAKQVVLEALKLGQGQLERIAAANRQLSVMAHHVVQRLPRIVAQLHGKLGVVRREGQGRVAVTVQRLRDQLQHMAGLVQRVIHQNAERFQDHHVPNKVLSLHEPHVVAIRKGKRGKPTEYGCKVSLAMNRHGFVVTHREYPANLADAETLPDALEGWSAVLGQPPTELAADRGFHHAESDRQRLGTATISRLSIPRKGKTRHPEADTAWFKRLQRLRAQSEPVIGHLKTDHRMDRCRYRGFAGDQINVSWAVLAWNTKKWSRVLQQRLQTEQRAYCRAA